MTNKLILVVLYLVLILTACTQSQQTIPTPMPTITPIPGWHKISNEGFEIWLPESFIGGNNLDADKIIEQMVKLGPEFEQQANSLKASKTSFLIFAFDKNKEDTGLITNMIVSKETVPGNISVIKYVETIGSRLSKPYEVIEKNSLSSGRYPIGILITRVNTPQIGEVSQVMYAIKNGGAVWSLVFTTPSSQFQERLQVFEEIAQTAYVPFTPENTARQGNPIIFAIGVALIIISLLLKPWLSRMKKQGAKGT